ncbi:MAG: DUF2846 domain-containing protein [Acidobacteria bacterium]|nr:DUF2846 domain-containing protein [Acidobacteriota bacterium]
MSRLQHVTGSALLVLAVIGLGACSSSTPPQSASSVPSAQPSAPASAVAAPDSTDLGFVVVYRQKRIVGAALNTSVYLDGTEVADLDPGTYVKVKATPGQHRMWADEERDAQTVTVAAGTTVYFRMELVPGLWKGHGRLVAVDAADGAAEFAEWHPKPTDSVRAATLVAQ